MERLELTPAAAVGPAELRVLYERYKGLTLSAAAALMLGATVAELAKEAEALVAHCREAAAAGGELEPQLAACVRAAEELNTLLGRSGPISGGELEPVRAAHRRLRREVWKVLPCEYVPCSGSYGHGAATGVPGG
jgi:hypothetical protein